MNANAMFVLGIVCLIACVICTVVAVNSDNTTPDNSPAGSATLGLGKMSPDMPFMTKVYSFLAFLLASGGISLLIMGRKKSNYIRDYYYPTFPR